MNTLKMLWTTMRGINRPVSRDASRDYVADQLRVLLPKCPSCNNPYTDHWYVLFATAAADGDNDDVGTLLDLLKRREWREARTCRSWIGDRDNTEAYIVRCNQERDALVVLVSPFELLFSDYLVHCEILNELDRRTIMAIVPSTDWKSFIVRSGAGHFIKATTR